MIMSQVLDIDIIKMEVCTIVQNVPVNPTQFDRLTMNSFALVRSIVECKYDQCGILSFEAVVVT